MPDEKFLQKSSDLFSSPNLQTKNDLETDKIVENFTKADKTIEQIKDLNNFRLYTQCCSNLKKMDSYGNVGLVEYLKSMLKKVFCFIKLTSQDRVILECEDLYRKEIDISKILTRLHEIDKIKFVLFTPEQLSLLKLFEKPIIFVSAQKYIEKDEKKRENENDLGQMEENYMKIIEKKEKTATDERILDLIRENTKIFADDFI